VFTGKARKTPVGVNSSERRAIRRATEKEARRKTARQTSSSTASRAAGAVTFREDLFPGGPVTTAICRRCGAKAEAAGASAKKLAVRLLQMKCGCLKGEILFL